LSKDVVQYPQVTVYISGGGRF